MFIKMFTLATPGDTEGQLCVYTVYRDLVHKLFFAGGGGGGGGGGVGGGCQINFVCVSVVFMYCTCNL